MSLPVRRKDDDFTFEIDGEVVTILHTGELQGDMSFEEWRAMGEALMKADQDMQWRIGDWLNFGEQHFPEIFAQALPDNVTTGAEDIKNRYRVLQWVCSRIPEERRRHNLPFAYHSEVAALVPEEQDKWLDLTEQNNWKRKELRGHLAMVKELPQPPAVLQTVTIPTDNPEQAAYILMRHVEAHNLLRIADIIRESVQV